MRYFLFTEIILSLYVLIWNILKHTCFWYIKRQRENWFFTFMKTQNAANCLPRHFPIIFRTTTFKNYPGWLLQFSPDIIALGFSFNVPFFLVDFFQKEHLHHRFNTCFAASFDEKLFQSKIFNFKILLSQELNLKKVVE